MSNDIELVKERDSNRDLYLKQLREKLTESGVGNGAKFDDNFLVKFLRAKLYDVDGAFDRLKSYLSLFEKYPKLFDGIDAGRRSVEMGVFKYPRGGDSKVRIGNICVGNWEPNEVGFEPLMASIVSGFELAALEEDVQQNGLFCIIDCQNMGMKQFRRLGLTEIKMAVTVLDNALPTRWRKLYVCNQTHLFDVVYTMAKPFISKELKEKLEFVGNDYGRMHQEIPKEVLPARYGGSCEEQDSSEFLKELKVRESDLLKLWEPCQDAAKK